MANINSVTLLGNLTKAPDVRSIPGSGKPVARSSIAINRKYKDKEEVCFIDLVAFGRTAEIMGEFLTKGSMVVVEGRLSQNMWEQDGVKRSKHEIIVERLQMVGGKFGKEVSEKCEDAVRQE